jgi:F-type H+-transporting ATPase subunit b
MMRDRNRRRRLAVGLTLMALGLLVFTTTALAVEGGGHGEGPKGWIATDTYRVINFGILALGLFLLLRKPLSNALGARIQGIREQLADLEARKAEAEKNLAAYNDKLARLDREAETIVQQYIQQGEEAKARIIEEAKETAVKLEAQAKRNIETEFQRAKDRLQAEAVEKALAAAERIIREKITQKDQSRLVDEYLKKVVA